MMWGGPNVGVVAGVGAAVLAVRQADVTAGEEVGVGWAPEAEQAPSRSPLVATRRPAKRRRRVAFTPGPYGR
jgi:hypothetical protein